MCATFLNVRCSVTSSQTTIQVQHEILIFLYIKSARAHNLLGIEFEIRLAIAELERKAGQDSEAYADLIALEKAARAKGFGLIAANASHLLEAGAKPVADSDLRFR
jgi:hypothetical protein